MPTHTPLSIDDFKISAMFFSNETFIVSIYYNIVWEKHPIVSAKIVYFACLIKQNWVFLLQKLTFYAQKLENCVESRTFAPDF